MAELQDTLEVEAIHSLRFERKLYRPGSKLTLDSALAKELASKGHAIIVDFVEADLEEDEIIEDLQEMLDITSSVEKVLFKAGLDTVAKIKKVSREDLIALKGIAEKSADDILKAVEGFED
jgi:DNA-directed RNA polymerase alpha subunit